MESDQLRRISIICISILCLSPIEFFSNKLFENKKEDNVIISYTDIKLEPNYLSNNYEIFNPNIKTTSEEIISLVSENKKKEITESENNLESEPTNEKNTENSVKNIKEEKVEVVEEKVKETSTSTAKKEREVSKKTEETTTNKKVEQAPVETPKVEEKTIKQETKKEVTSTETKVQETTEKNNVSSNTTIVTSLINYAKQFVGNPYRYGGTDLNNGVDCSGFTMKVFEHFGYSLPHSSGGQSSYGTYVSTDSLMPGDLIFYGYSGSISHVAIYIGNGEIVHATTNSGGIKIASYTMMPIITARRILN